MDKLAFMTGYYTGIDNAVGKIQDKYAAIVPEQKLYGVAPEALESYQYDKTQKNLQKQRLAKILGITAGAATGAGIGASKGGKWGAILGAITGGTAGGGVAHGLVDEGLVGADKDKGRPFADVVRDIKVRAGGPGTSFEEQYMQPFKRSEIK